MNLKNILFVLAYVGLLGVFCFAGYCFYADFAVHGVKQQTAPLSDAASAMTYIDLPQISVSLPPKQGLRGGTVRMEIALEVEKRYAMTIESNSPRIADRLVNYTGTLDFDELSRPHATSWLKPDLLIEINKVSISAPIHDIIFREFTTM